jgi:hypothetical protein
MKRVIRNEKDEPLKLSHTSLVLSLSTREKQVEVLVLFLKCLDLFDWRAY